MADARDQDYKARLGAVLRLRDPGALHLFLRQSAAGYGDERQVTDVEERSHEEMTELLHRMILARNDLADLHAESRAWLAERHLSAPEGPRRRAAGPDGRGRRAERRRDAKRGRPGGDRNPGG